MNKLLLSPFTRFCHESLSPLLSRDQMFTLDIPCFDLYSTTKETNFSKVRQIDSSLHKTDLDLIDCSPILKNHSLNTTDLISRSILADLKIQPHDEKTEKITHFDDKVKNILSSTSPTDQNPPPSTQKESKTDIISSKSSTNEEKTELPDLNLGGKCSCKRSQCLKLYCDCFAQGLICGPDCGCLDCKNNTENLETRNKIITGIFDKNPEAFRGMTLTSLVGNAKGHAPAFKGFKGCNCKKSGCEKKYCECYTAGMRCTSRCCCTNCRNHETTPEKKRKRKMKNGKRGMLGSEGNVSIEGPLKKYQIGQDFVENNAIITKINQVILKKGSKRREVN